MTKTAADLALLVRNAFAVQDPKTLPSPAQTPEELDRILACITKEAELCGDFKTGVRFGTHLLETTDIKPSVAGQCDMGTLHYGAHDLGKAERCYAHAMPMPGRKLMALEGLKRITCFRSLLPYQNHSYPITRPAPKTDENAPIRTMELGPVHVTIDDGPHPIFTPILLDLLKKWDQRATFFVLGQGVEAYPDLIQEMVDAGHDVYGHSYDHTQHYSAMPSDVMLDDITRTEALLTPFRDTPSPLYYRFPGGVGHFDTTLQETLGRAMPDLQVTHWHALCRDSQLMKRVQHAAHRQIEMIGTIGSLLSNVHGAGEILLLHDLMHNFKASAEQIEVTDNFYDLLFAIMQDRNLRSIPLSDANIRQV